MKTCITPIYYYFVIGSMLLLAPCQTRETFKAALKKVTHIGVEKDTSTEMLHGEILFKY